MAAAVSTSHFPIPTPQELRHNFLGSDCFTIYLNHAFHQPELDNESKDLFIFYGPDNTLRRLLLLLLLLFINRFYLTHPLYMALHSNITFTQYPHTHT